MESKDEPKEEYFERFAFDDSPEMADELLTLVLSGKKTATVSIYTEGENMPGEGDLSLVLDGKGNPACEIKTVSVESVRICELAWDMVKPEGGRRCL